MISLLARWLNREPRGSGAQRRGEIKSCDGGRKLSCRAARGTHFSLPDPDEHLSSSFVVLRYLFCYFFISTNASACACNLSISAPFSIATSCPSGRLAALHSASICAGVGDAGLPIFSYSGNGDPCPRSTIVTRACFAVTPLSCSVIVFGTPFSSGKNKFHAAIASEPSFLRVNSA